MFYAMGHDPRVSTSSHQTLFMIMQANTSMQSKRVAAPWTVPYPALVT